MSKVNMRLSKPFLRGDVVQSRHTSIALTRRSSLIVRALQVRPYTTRKGDTLETIADKRGFSTDELVKLNHAIDMSSIEEGTTLLLPAEKLSDRDREIISGIGTRYRTYPIREGETIEDIISKRDISMDEFVEMNPGIDIHKIQADEVLKLPVGKYTVREKEMMIGALGVPAQYFQNKGLISTSGIGIAIVVSLLLWWRSRRH